MHSILTKIKNVIFSNYYNAKILGDVFFSKENVPHYSVKMKGCNLPIDISAEQILDKFVNNFSQADIVNITKAYMLYKSKLVLLSIEKNFAILSNNQNDTLSIIDLKDNLCTSRIDFDNLDAHDAFILGIEFEKIRNEKDKNLFLLAKPSNKIAEFKLVK